MRVILIYVCNRLSCDLSFSRCSQAEKAWGEPAFQGVVKPPVMVHPKFGRQFQPTPSEIFGPWQRDSHSWGLVISSLARRSRQMYRLSLRHFGGPSFGHLGRSTPLPRHGKKGTSFSDGQFVQGLKTWKRAATGQLSGESSGSCLGCPGTACGRTGP